MKSFVFLTALLALSSAQTFITPATDIIPPYEDTLTSVSTDESSLASVATEETSLASLTTDESSLATEETLLSSVTTEVTSLATEPQVTDAAVSTTEQALEAEITSAAPIFRPAATPTRAARPVIRERFLQPTQTVAAPTTVKSPDMQQDKQAQPIPIKSVATKTKDQEAEVVEYVNEIDPQGNYEYKIVIDNGIAAEQSGVQILSDNDQVSSSAVKGSYSWISPEGVDVGITYTADERGFIAEGSAIPTPPPIPPLIARALEWIARVLAAQENQVNQENQANPSEK